MSPPLAVILSGWPRRSETFALQELLALDDRGLLGPVFATKLGDGAALQPGAERLLARVRVLAAAGPEAQAEEVAEAVDGRRVRGVHAYFAHAPAEVAQRAARRLRVPFGFSVHARDARKVRPRELGARARAAACVVACNDDVARDVRSAGGDVTVVRHGVDVERFSPQPRPPAGPPALLAVGRLVPKKGFDVLVEAAARLAFPFRLRIVGDGPERDRLRDAIGRHGLAGCIELTGPMTHAELPAAYAAADVVVAPSVVDASGDRDGLPNVVLEAMAAGRPVVASDVGAIRSAVVHGRTGFLTRPGDADELARVLTALASDTESRARLGAAARARAVREFGLPACTDRLARFLAEAYG